MPHLSKIILICCNFIWLIVSVERIPIESVDKENELLRGKNRYSKLFSSYPPQADVSEYIDEEKRNRSLQFLVSIFTYDQ